MLISFVISIYLILLIGLVLVVQNCWTNFLATNQGLSFLNCTKEFDRAIPCYRNKVPAYNDIMLKGHSKNMWFFVDISNFVKEICLD